MRAARGRLDFGGDHRRCPPRAGLETLLRVIAASAMTDPARHEVGKQHICSGEVRRLSAGQEEPDGWLPSGVQHVVWILVLSPPRLRPSASAASVPTLARTGAVRWARTMVASIMAYSLFPSSAQRAWNTCGQTPLLAQRGAVTHPVTEALGQVAPGAARPIPVRVACRQPVVPRRPPSAHPPAAVCLDPCTLVAAHTRPPRCPSLPAVPTPLLPASTATDDTPKVQAYAVWVLARWAPFTLLSHLGSTLQHIRGKMIGGRNFGMATSNEQGRLSDLIFL